MPKTQPLFDGTPRAGSLFSGIGGLDLAVEHVFGAHTAWQLDLVGHEVRAVHWPEAVQVVADVSTFEHDDILALGPIDILAGGFSCKGVSTAGKGELLGHPETRVTYLGLLRFAQVLRPRLVVIENTPKMLTGMGDLVRQDYGALGYGVTFVRCKASDVGAPHKRARVFAVCELGRGHGPVLDAGVLVPTLGPRPWPTATAGDAKASGSRSLSTSKAHPGTSLTDAVCVHRVRAEDLRLWPTATSRDYKCGQLPTRQGGEALSQAAAHGKRLNPDWAEPFMGFPVGWTDAFHPGASVWHSPSARRHVRFEDHRWPRARYPKDWPRHEPWPGHDWEPSRVLPDGPPIRGRGARIKALGNACVPQQVAWALRVWSCTP